MLVRVITLKFHAATEGFDDEEVREFIKDKEVLSIREHFFIRHETPYLVLVVTYLPGADAPDRSKKKKEAWRESLSDEQMPLFETLRNWRTERAKQDRVPPYVICTNQQFADMLAARPDSLAGLSKIRGFGKAKAEKYGNEILAVLAQPPKPPRDTTPSGEQGPEQEEPAVSEGNIPPHEHDSQQTMFAEKAEGAPSAKGTKPAGQRTAQRGDSMKKTRRDEPVIFVKWLEFLKWLLPVTGKFPKRVRFTLADRIDNLALDLVEELVEAQYSRDKQDMLKQANLTLEKLRVLLRISCEQQYLSHTAYEYAMRSINEVGRMLGGWIKQQQEKNI